MFYCFRKLKWSEDHKIRSKYFLFRLYNAHFYCDVIWPLKQTRNSTGSNVLFYTFIIWPPINIPDWTFDWLYTICLFMFSQSVSPPSPDAFFLSPGATYCLKINLFHIIYWCLILAVTRTQVYETISKCLW